MKTTQETFRKMRLNARQGLATHIGIITDRKFKMISKAVEDFKRETEMDKKLRVINEEEYNAEIKAYELLKKSLATADII